MVIKQTAPTSTHHKNTGVSKRGDSMDLGDVGDKIKTTVKRNPLLIAGAVGGVILFVVLSNKKGTRQITEEESDGLIAYNGAYASYPDAVTNAESIVSSMTENLNYAMDSIREDFSAQLGAFDDRLDDINESRLEDREYYKEGMDSLKELWQQNNQEMLDKVSDQISNIYDKDTPVSNYTPTQYVTNNNTYITTTDTQKPPATTSNTDIGALKDNLSQLRANKVTNNRDDALANLSQGLSINNKRPVVAANPPRVVSQSNKVQTMTGVPQKVSSNTTLRQVKNVSMAGTNWSK